MHRTSGRGSGPSGAGRVAQECARWVRLVEENPSFRFTAKLWRRFTHDRDSAPGMQDAERVHEGLRPLVETGRLGALLVQFPWRFRRTRENRLGLARILDFFEGYPLVVELRHGSWNRPKAYEGLPREGLGFVPSINPVS